MVIKVHLDLVLLPLVLDGLEDGPCVPPPYLQPGAVPSVPPLDQQRCFQSWKKGGQFLFSNAFLFT